MGFSGAGKGGEGVEGGQNGVEGGKSSRQGGPEVGEEAGAGSYAGSKPLSPDHMAPIWATAGSSAQPCTCYFSDAGPLGCLGLTLE